jgi:hypothetical protein
VDTCAFKWSETARCGYRCWANLEMDKTQEQAWFEKAERETRQTDWYRNPVAQRHTMAEAEELRKCNNGQCTAEAAAAKAGVSAAIGTACSGLVKVSAGSPAPVVSQGSLLLGGVIPVPLTPRRPPLLSPTPLTLRGPPPVSPAPMTLHGFPPFSAAPWTPRGPAPVSPAPISGRPSTRYIRRPCSSGVSGLAVDVFITTDTRRAAPLPFSSDYAGLVFIVSSTIRKSPLSSARSRFSSSSRTLSW